MVLVITCTTLLEDIDNMKLLLIHSLGSIIYQFVYGFIPVQYSNLRIFIVMYIHSYCVFMYFRRIS